MMTTDPASSPATEVKRRSRRRRRRASPIERLDLIGVTCCAAGAAVVLNPARATAFRVVDLALCAALAALVTLAGSRAHRWSLIWLAGIATIGAVGSVWLLPALVALVLGGVIAAARKRSRLLDAVIAALAIQAVLRFGDVGFQGVPTILAVVAVAPVLVSGYRGSSSTIQRNVRRAGFGVAAFVAVATLAAGAAGLAATSSFDAGVAAADSGLQSLAAGEQAAAAADFDEAADSFAGASTLAGGPWTWPSWVVPGVAPQVRALAAGAGAVADVSSAAADTARVAPYTEVALVGGTVDVTRLAGMADAARQQAEVVASAQRDVARARSSWLVPPIAEPLARLADGLDAATPAVEGAADLTAVAPAMLGADGARRYLVVVTDSADSRFSGGAAVAYGELTAADGQVTLTRWGPIADLAGTDGADGGQGDRVFLDRYGRTRAQERPENLVASPDIPTALNALGDRLGRAGGAPIDGVVVVDPIGLAALIGVTGPVTVPGAPQPLTAENAGTFLLTGQYVAGATDTTSLLGATGEAVAAAVLGGNLPGAARAGEALVAAVEDGHLQVSFTDPQVQEVFAGRGATGAFPDREGGDAFSVRTANDGGARLDASLTRTVDYDAVFDPETGRVDATATVTFTNSIPTDALASPAAITADGSPPGTAALYASFYSPLPLRGADLDGAPLPIEPQREFAGNVYSAKLVVAPGATAVVRLRLAGSIDADPEYRLTLSSQPLVSPEPTTVTVTAARGWTIDGRPSTELTVPGRGSTVVAVELERS